VKYRVEVTARAEADIEEAYAWYAERSPEGAARWDGELSRAINTLERFPSAAPSHSSSLRPSGSISAASSSDATTPSSTSTEERSTS